jgi:hypothetical protein
MTTKVFTDESEVIPLLIKMRLPRHVLLELASKVAGERANVAECEPTAVVGFETWRWGTRFSREDETLKKLAWVSCDRDQVNGIRNPDIGIKLVVCSTDLNTGNLVKAPKNITERGPASCKLIGANSQQIKMDFIAEGPNDELWYLCLHLSDKWIAIEVSRPDSEIGGVINNFSHRIVVAPPGEIPGIRKVVVSEDFADVPRPQVERKRG